MQRRKKETQKKDEKIRKFVPTESETNEENIGGEAGEVSNNPGGTERGAEEETNRVGDRIW